MKDASTTTRTVMAIVALALGVAPACSLIGSPGPSAVSQSKRYQSGHETYDTFFMTVHEAQMALGGVPDTEKKIRGKLAKKLGLEGATSATFLAKSLKKFTADLESRGTALDLEVNGLDESDPEDVDVRMKIVGKEIDGDAKETVRAVEKAAEEAAGLAVVCSSAKRKIDQLVAAAPELDKNLDEVFRREGIAKKAEVRKNMDDAKELVPLMLERATKFLSKSQKLLDKIKEAAHTNTGQFDEPPPPPEPVEDGGEGGEEPSSGEPGGGPASAPTPAPAPKPPPSSSDFEP